MAAAPCVCGSGLASTDCCQPCLEGVRHAPTPEALMRSRYTAYVERNSSYLLSTWHPTTRPKVLELPTAESLNWLGLTVLRADGKRVEYIARYKEGGETRELHEDSRFVYEQGRWFYIDGRKPRSTLKTGRNQPCPCGSGKKFKRCCGLSS